MSLSIRKKLFGLGLITLVVGAAIWGLSYWGLSRTDEAMDAAAEAAEAQRNQMAADMMHDALRADVFAALLADKNDAEEIKRVRDDVAEHVKNIREYMVENRKHIVDGEALKMLMAVEPTVNGYAEQAAKMVALGLSDPAAAKSQLPGFLDVFKSLEDSMEKLSDKIAEDAKAARAAGDAVVTRTETFMSILVIVAVLMMAVCTYLVGISIVRPLGRTVELLKDIAEGEGDLTKRLDVKSRDEIGELAKWFDTFMGKLHDIMIQVGSVTENVASASQQLSAASEQLSSGAQEQASSLEETAASLEQITGTVKQNADNAKQANQLAVGSRDTAEKGGEVVNTAVSAMGEINKSSKKIADIITTIDEIAFQTNLLALNAAVEAARAGEQGRGFAVVAAEVRSLAQRSATAAKEIKGLIQDSVQKVQDGSELVNKSGQTLGEIVASVKKVTDIIGEISAASQEQSGGIDQVNKAVSQMDQVVQSNAAQTEELSSTAQSLTNQAQQLQALVGKFKLDRSAHAVSRPAASVTYSPGGKAHHQAPLHKPAKHVARTTHTGNGPTKSGEAGFEEF
jgi:methyl-accepting chemotaxis protein